VYGKDIVDEIYQTDDVKSGAIARRAAKEEGILV
jgi:cysteine synthase A